MFETEVDGTKFCVHTLGRGSDDTSTYRYVQLNGQVAPNTANGGSEIRARIPWPTFSILALAVVVLIVLFIGVALTPQDAHWYTVKPGYWPAERPFLLLTLPIAILGAIYVGIGFYRLPTEFLCDLLEAEKVG